MKKDKTTKAKDIPSVTSRRASEGLRTSIHFFFFEKNKKKKTYFYVNLSVCIDMHSFLYDYCYLERKVRLETEQICDGRVGGGLHSVWGV